jgi:hypothetical protein
VNLTTHFLLMLGLRMRVVTPLLPPHAFIVLSLSTETALILHYAIDSTGCSICGPYLLVKGIVQGLTESDF